MLSASRYVHVTIGLRKNKTETANGIMLRTLTFARAQPFQVQFSVLFGVEQDVLVSGID